MKYADVYEAIEVEYGSEVALTTCQVLAIAMSTKVKRKDLSEKGRYSKRIKKKANDALWEVDEGQRELAIRLWLKVHDWSTGIAMEGLGGCTRKSFKELLQNADNNN